AYVRRIAEEKGRAVAPRVGDRIVLAADTTVVVDEMMLAKPEDDADATRMLRMLSGRTHEVLTAVSVWHGKQMFTEIERTDGEFVPLSEFEIDWYVATGEPRYNAGASATHGYASRACFCAAWSPFVAALIRSTAMAMCCFRSDVSAGPRPVRSTPRPRGRCLPDSSSGEWRRPAHPGDRRRPRRCSRGSRRCGRSRASACPDAALLNGRPQRLVMRARQRRTGPPRSRGPCGWSMRPPERRRAPAPSEQARRPRWRGRHRVP